MPLGAAALPDDLPDSVRGNHRRAIGLEQIWLNRRCCIHRDFAIEFTAAASLVMVHLSRLSEELILWMSPRFGFIDIADRFCNEVVHHAAEEKPRRARTPCKSGRVIGHLIGLITLMKSTFGDNKDNQEDKEP